VMFMVRAAPAFMLVAKATAITAKLSVLIFG
jgi:hypothetical protein